MMQNGQDPQEALRQACRSDAPFLGCYLFCGEEEYLKQYYLEKIRARVVDVPQADCFDHIRLRGSDREEGPLSERLAAAFATPPVLCSGKLIEISEPGFREMRQGELTALCDLCRAAGPNSETVLVILCSEEELNTQDYRAASAPVYRALNEAMTVVPFHRESREKLIPWCRRHFETLGVTASPAVAGYLIDRCGRSMYTLCGEIDKLAAHLKIKGRTAVTEADIRFICPLREEGVAFGLSDAVMKRDVDAALREYRVAKREKTDEIVIFAQLFSVLLDLYRVRCATDEGLTPRDIAALFRMKEGRVSVLQRGARSYTREELAALTRLGSEVDYGLKYTLLPKDVLLLRLICAISR